MAARTPRRPANSRPARDEPDEAPDGDADDGTEDTPAARRSSSRPARREVPSGRARPKPRDEEPADDDEEDEEKGQTRTVIRGGWKTFKAKKEASSDFPTDFKVELGEKYVIAILDEEPFASFRQHWIDEAPKKKSFICLEDDCPLCDILNDKPRVLATFNVVEFVKVIEKGKTIIEPLVKVWQIGTSIAEQLEGLAEDPKLGPLTDQYWVVSKTGKGPKTRYSINKVKERDLLDDYGIDPLTDDEFAELEEKVFDSSVIRYTDRKELKELAHDVAGD